MRVLRSLGFTSCFLGFGTDEYVARTVFGVFVLVGAGRIELILPS